MIISFPITVNIIQDLKIKFLFTKLNKRYYMTLREKMKELQLKNIKVKINKSACISWNNRDREESYGPTVQENTRDIVRLLRINMNSYFPLSSELKIVRRLVRLQLYKTIVENLLKRMVLLTVGCILTVLSLMNTYYSKFTN